MNITTKCHCACSHADPIFSFFPLTRALAGLALHSAPGPLTCTTLVDLEQVGNLLEDQEADLLEHLLSEDERAFFRRFHFAKRRREWLGGRIAAKAAVLELNNVKEWGARLHGMTILPDEHGRPMVDGIKELSLSISHSNRFAVARLVNNSCCGIDLQQISPKLLDLTGRFAAAGELALLGQPFAHEDLATRLTMLWAAKEALKKSILFDQPVFFSGITLEKITADKEQSYLFSCTVDGHARQDAMVYNFSPYILSLTDTVSFSHA